MPSAAPRRGIDPAQDDADSTSRRRRGDGIIVRMKHLVIVFAVTLASCTQTSRPQNGPARPADAGGGAVEGSENQSDASRTRSRT